MISKMTKKQIKPWQSIVTKYDEIWWNYAKQKLEATTKTAVAKRDAAIAKQMTAESKKRIQEAKEKAYNEKAQKTAQKNNTETKTIIDTTAPVERRETAPEGLTEQIRKGGRPKGSQNLRVLERYQQRVMTIQNQQAGVKDRYNTIKGFQEKEMSR